MGQPLLARGKGAMAVSFRGRERTNFELICKLDGQAERGWAAPATSHLNCRDDDAAIDMSIMNIKPYCEYHDHFTIHLIQMS